MTNNDEYIEYSEYRVLRRINRNESGNTWTTDAIHKIMYTDDKFEIQKDSEGKVLNWISGALIPYVDIEEDGVMIGYGTIREEICRFLQATFKPTLFYDTLEELDDGLSNSYEGLPCACRESNSVYTIEEKETND